MRDRLRVHVSPAMIVALIALAMAASGVAYAVTKAPKNSVTTKSIVNGAVTGAKVKDNSLTGADVTETALGIVPKAAQAGRATSADSATSATQAGHATTADVAFHAEEASHAGNATT